MHPMQARIWRYALAALALTEVLSQITSLPFPLGWHSVPFILACLVLVALIILEVLNRIWFFAPIRIFNADVFIDSLPLRQVVAGSKLAPQDVFLKVKVVFVLLWGSGGVMDEVTIEWSEEITNELNPLISTSKHSRTVRLQPTTREGIIELRLGIPKSLNGSRSIAIKSQTYNKQLADKMDALSERIENGHYRIIWQTSLGKKRTYKAKRRSK